MGYATLYIGDVELVIDKHLEKDGLIGGESVLETSADENLLENDDVAAALSLHKSSKHGT